MAFDPSIISAIPDMVGNPMAAKEKAVTLSDMMDRAQLTQLHVQGEKTAAAENAKVNEILKGSDYSTPKGLSETAAKVNRVSPKSAMELLKTGQQYQSGQIQLQIDQLTLADKRMEGLVTSIDPIIGQARQMKANGASDLEVNAFIAAKVPETVQNLRQTMMEDGKPLMPDETLKVVSQAPKTLATLESWEAGTKQGQQLIKQRLEQFKADTAAKGEATRERHEDETERHNRSMEANAAAKASQGAFGDQERDLLAALAVRNVNLPAGLRSQQQIKATLQGLLGKFPDKSPDQIADDIKSGKLKLAAETKGAQTAGTQIGKVALAANEMDIFGDQTLQASAAVPRGKFVPWNKLKNMARGQVSSPELLRFSAKMNALENAYNQLAARSGTDVEKRAHIHKLFNEANSPEAVQTLVQALKEEAVGAREGANRTIAETSGEAIPGAGPSNPTPPANRPKDSPPASGKPAAAGALQPGNVYQHKSGAKVEILD